MGKDVWFYSLTLEPENDDPEELRRYAERFEVGPGWLFLTGKPEDMEALRESLGFTFSDPALDADQTQHIGVVKMANVPLGWWGAVPSMSAPEQIVQLVRWMEPGARGSESVFSLASAGKEQP